jgi:hypothetical protein
MDTSIAEWMLYIKNSNTKPQKVADKEHFQGYNQTLYLGSWLLGGRFGLFFN